MPLAGKLSLKSNNGKGDVTASSSPQEKRTAFFWCTLFWASSPSFAGCNGGYRGFEKLVRNFQRPKDESTSTDLNSYLISMASVTSSINRAGSPRLPEQSRPNLAQEITAVAPGGGEGYRALEEEEGENAASNRISTSRASFYSARESPGSPKQTAAVAQIAASQGYPSRTPTEYTPIPPISKFVVPPHLIVAPAQKLEGWRLIVVEIWYVLFAGRVASDFC